LDVLSQLTRRSDRRRVAFLAWGCDRIGGAEAARQGDHDRANDRLSTAKEILEGYLMECLDG
jgi:hypothetical protein